MKIGSSSSPLVSCKFEGKSLLLVLHFFLMVLWVKMLGNLRVCLRSEFGELVWLYLFLFGED